MSVVSTSLMGQVVDVTKATENDLRNWVNHLSLQIGERNLANSDKLRACVVYLRQELEKQGFRAESRPFGVGEATCENLIVEIKGSKNANEIVLLGAHYDSARGTPGANDNASGAAALLSLSKMCRTNSFDRTLRFVWFVNEEPPHFQKENEMGSWVYARECRSKQEDLKLVVSLETIGYFTDQPNSQNYPPLIAHLYPSTGNFIGFVSDIPSRPLLNMMLGKFRKHSDVPAYGASLPAEIQGVGWSDHWSFWQEGYQAIMLTDTAVYRYPHYHQPTDTPDKLDFVRLAKVVNGLHPVIVEIANEP
jgi:Zn-dependent M28 family amino/carboxypeptidase